MVPTLLAGEVSLKPQSPVVSPASFARFVVAFLWLTHCALCSGMIERLVGVNSGGMDQAASVFSKPLHLLHM